MVAAELRSFQITPPLDPAVPDTMDEETFMLPILAHLDGHAVPSVDGTFLMYQFPSLTSRAYVGNLSSAQLEARDPLEPFAGISNPYVIRSISSLDRFIVLVFKVYTAC